ncbi:hypothetical protein ACRE_031900 [Hapsidospora chrysogenum ATCC 11550]|uniref:Uncharacterized protein n=1 Tax=Hapsidospora chrysogenum (strain ATCC 11550 / CBS 779.69 / DSM 880 / IAM 14645 / JCM 23072 / IMI 49137) TaxID=857340 RepID=A0A086T9J2_HAPC1|nr:hypothetical protein ACRE_031900 [Hapsidospora chrysogenum ATCC 11550]
MLGITGRRAALGRAPVPAAVPIRAPADASSPSPTHCRGFRSTPTQAAFRPAWMPMRVKTPWIEALTRSRDADDTARDGGTPRAQPPDLKPKRISDSSYTAILPLAQDKWLLDTYLNASGHIRYYYIPIIWPPRPRPLFTVRR